MTDIHFGTDGWRGVIADEVTFSSVRLVARAIARCVLVGASGEEAPHILIGYDTRFLSREFAQAAAGVMAGEGVQVSLAESFAPTPALSYAVVRLGATGGVVITASHNPPLYSGVKLKTAFGGSAPATFTQAIEEEIQRLQADSREPDGEGNFEIRNSKFEIAYFDPRVLWLDRLEELADVPRIGKSRMRVVLDVMYGAGQGLLAGRLRQAGCEVRELHAEVNPTFGGLHPEPIPRYMGALIEEVKGWTGPKHPVGFAFDGDSDRIAPVDELGNVLSPHQTLALLVRHLARNRRERGAVVKSVNIGRMVELEAAALGLPVAVTPIGFKYIAAAMREHGALVGGEESGGFAVRGHIPERDPGLVCLLLLECMAMTGKSLGMLVREMETEYGPHRYGRIDLRLPTLADRDRVVASLKAAPPGELLSKLVRQVDSLDGVKLIRADHSWVMLRASGTEPLLRIYAEAPTDAEVESLLMWGRRTTLGEA